MTLFPLVEIRRTIQLSLRINEKTGCSIETLPRVGTLHTSLVEEMCVMYYA